MGVSQLLNSGGPLLLRSDFKVPVLFAARMLVIYLVGIRRMKHILPPFLPFIPGLETISQWPFLFYLLDAIYWVCLAMVFLGYRFQRFSLILGLLVFFSILGSKTQFSNSFLFSGSLLFLIGLYRPGMEWIFRIQIALLYIGAGVNKLLDPDWQSGQYFIFFFSEVYPNSLFQMASVIMGEFSVAKILSWLTIIIEFTFGLWVLTGKKPILLFFSIQGFHLTMLLLTSGELSYIFYFLMAVSGYLILPWQEIVDQKQQSAFVFPKKSWTLNHSQEKAHGVIKTWNIYMKMFFISCFDRVRNFVFCPISYGLFVICVTFLCIYKKIVF
ncbi:hypothetical protein Ataiwa_15130 [Algoriphagus taiwanensis]|uniref:HTTM domain-containing protein n=2 Tax=Algoriphagus taiwanensis TaxID=1445656 RepID=A0ABQ6Q056_9BACT|nr:hypothetical protein Ataiwa_15130 [Algoriphagus taiwanensis]